MLTSIENKKLKVLSKISVENIVNLFNSSIQGLDQLEAKKRNKKYGNNVIKQSPKSHILFEFLAQFKNPLVFILLWVSLISLLTSEKVNALIIFLMVCLSVILDFVQEHKAGKAAEKLKEKLISTTQVFRDKKLIELNSSQLTLGDVVVFNAGDLITADCIILESKDLYVTESVLTGESFPVEKHSNDIKKDTNILYSGTSVITGTAKALVVKIGDKTNVGNIAVNLDEKTENDFAKGTHSFSVLILKIILVLVVTLFGINTFLNRDVLESLLFSIAIAVGLTPEFLPMIMSASTGIGSLKMAKKGVIVKKLSSIPTFGSMDILATDKTGTLTENKIKLIKCVDAKGKDSGETFYLNYINSFYQTGINNPLDEAILNFKNLKIKDVEKIDEIPFDFERKRLSIVCKIKDELYLVTKGAPEEILDICCDYKINNKKLKIEDPKNLYDEYHKLSKEGFRVIGVAVKKLQGNAKRIYEADIECDMQFVGFSAFFDPPRVGVKQVIDSLEDMGIEIKIISGDNELVTEKICKEIGINIKGILLGTELQKHSDEALLKIVENTTIFARFSPNDKERIIKLLKQNKHVVGYMGDGINDSPSLKTADVGISVSNAVSVAKESADIILTTKSLEELKEGVIEGRKTFANTMKYIMMALSSNFGNMFSVLGAVLYLPFLPMLPIQILLNNFLYDLSQVTIPLDNVDEEFIKKPKKWDINYIKNFMFVFGPISSIFDFLSFFVLFSVFKLNEGAFQTGWFMESLATQVLVILIIRSGKIPFIQSMPGKFLILSTVLVLSLGWLLPFSPIAVFFNFNPISIIQVLTIVLIVIVYLITVHLAKVFFFKKYFYN